MLSESYTFTIYSGMRFSYYQHTKSLSTTAQLRQLWFKAFYFTEPANELLSTQLNHSHEALMAGRRSRQNAGFTISRSPRSFRLDHQIKDEIRKRISTTRILFQEDFVEQWEVETSGFPNRSPDFPIKCTLGLGFTTATTFYFTSLQSSLIPCTGRRKLRFQDVDCGLFFLVRNWGS